MCCLEPGCKYYVTFTYLSAHYGLLNPKIHNAPLGNPTPGAFDTGRTSAHTPYWIIHILGLYSMDSTTTVTPDGRHIIHTPDNEKHAGNTTPSVESESNGRNGIKSIDFSNAQYDGPIYHAYIDACGLATKGPVRPIISTEKLRRLWAPGSVIENCKRALNSGPGRRQ
ncbi:hypothetical protein RSOL_099830 [Rhizoctonia solani AG-3 Rhs1AP]|uniref:Uncharacterized protein n=2 Tax=Rhizoctonia solani AG-3 TaxID=1086053 RepID=A0A074RNL2_9AGAM|nr:hypothetical protein RSOL_099830 [Rhizoctonia solani AG-3 Rhs1AP]KEP46935.1 hypothetical protein V565_174710 [Rhizoctonia solani 123E]